MRPTLAYRAPGICWSGGRCLSPGIFPGGSERPLVESLLLLVSSTGIIPRSAPSIQILHTLGPKLHEHDLLGLFWRPSVGESLLLPLPPFWLPGFAGPSAHAHPRRLFALESQDTRIASPPLAWKLPSPPSYLHSRFPSCQKFRYYLDPQDM